MAMNDDNMIKVMQSLGLDYGPAERATKAFEGRIASLNKQLFEMKANALKGAGDINRAFSSQIGQMSGSKTILDQFGQPLKVLNDNVASSFVKSTAAAKQHGQAVQDVAKKYNILGNEFQRRAQWFLSGTIFYGTLRAATETAQTISEVEMGVTEIARVMEDSSFVFKDYRDELLQLGVDYGQTFDTVQDIALRWAQAGYNVKDSLDNTKTSLLALNTAELNASNATESMIGIMAQWNMTSKDLPLVLDKINKTADDFTVTSQDLVDGLLRSSGAAKIMGLSLDETISLLTVMREASGRTGREVGNALNSILSYVQRPGSIKVLEGLGIQVFADAAKTQFRNVMLIFQDVASRWGQIAPEIQDGFIKSADDAGLYSEELAGAIGMQQEWNDLQQRDISQAAAGVYRRNYFIGMIERLSTAQGVLNNMTDAAGYSQAENARTMETLEKKYTSLKAAAQELAVALGDAGLLDMLKGLTEGAKNAADSFADLDDGTKALILTVLELLTALGAIKGVAGLLTARNLIFGAESVLALIGPWGQLAVAITAVVGALGLLVYNSSKASAQSIEDSLKNVDAKKNEVTEANNLIKKYEELEGKAVQNNEVKSEMLEIQRQLASIYPEYVDSLDDEGHKLDTNIPLLREMNGLKAQELDLERQKLVMDARNRLPQLETEQKQLQEQIDADKERLANGDTTRTMRKGTDITEIDMSGQIRKNLVRLYTELSKSRLESEKTKAVLDEMFATDYEVPQTRRNSYIPSTSTATPGSNLPLSSAFTEDSLKALYQANKVSLQTYLSGLRELVKTNYSEFVGKSSQELNDMLNSPGTSERAKEYLSLENEIQSATKKNSSEKNEALQDSLKLLDHQRNMSEETMALLEDELKNLKIIRDTYSMSGEERMDLEERIYNAEKALKDKALQDSINWINEKKALDELSAEQEIAAWNRVLTNQKNNIEAVKYATQNLYKLQKDLREDEVKEHKDSLKDLQDSIKDSYDERIDFIEKESDAKVKAIEKELEQLDRDEDERDYDKKMADLNEDEAYWSVRTGEEAREKLADIREQIAEAEHDRDVELKKQGLEDEKDAVKDAADAEKEKWEAAYKDMEKAFSDHNLDIIAKAAATSKEAFQQWYDNYIVPMQKAIKDGDVEGYEESAGKVGGSVSELESNSGSANSQIYQAAKAIVDLKKQYEVNGNTGAAQQAIQYYNELAKLSGGVADQLHSMDYETASQYLSTLPKLHGGGETLSYGMAYVKPGEVFFPPSFSTDLKTLIAVSSGITGKVANGDTYNSTDKSVINNFNAPLFNSEKTVFEDDTDETSFARELNRAILSLQ